MHFLEELKIKIKNKENISLMSYFKRREEDIFNSLNDYRDWASERYTEYLKSNVYENCKDYDGRYEVAKSEYSKLYAKTMDYIWSINDEEMRFIIMYYFVYTIANPFDFVNYDNLFYATMDINPYLPINEYVFRAVLDKLNSGWN